MVRKLKRPITIWLAFKGGVAATIFGLCLLDSPKACHAFNLLVAFM